jgi:benzoyl-CoA reductase/2-hydroxyglutaryl-CoA dehydratase subunit BcrC/BadD/HgdB
LVTVGAVGFTTSIPVEILLAAGRRPVDLNNAFISRPEAHSFVRAAETNGFPATCCAWMRGIYGVLSILDVDEVIAVVRGDCSQTQALMEVLQMEGTRVYPFAYPYDRSLRAIEVELGKLREHFGVEEAEVEEAKRNLDRIRRKLNRVDLLTWRHGLVTGEENHRFLVSSSDMNGDPWAFEREVDTFLEEASHREPCPAGEGIRLGYLGVPPIWQDLYKRIERPGVRVVFNEIQRQFSMPYLAPSMEEQYLRFTYPYEVFFRLEDIRLETARRGVDGFIHYTQTFCFRQIEDKILRHSLPKPVLTLEGDRPEPLDARTETRIEAFLEMLQREKGAAAATGDGN